MNTGVGYHFLLQGIFPSQGSNLGLPHCRQILYHVREALAMCHQIKHLEELQGFSWEGFSFPGVHISEGDQFVMFNACSPDR